MLEDVELELVEPEPDDEAPGDVELEPAELPLAVELEPAVDPLLAMELVDVALEPVAELLLEVDVEFELELDVELLEVWLEVVEPVVEVALEPVIDMPVCDCVLGWKSVPYIGSVPKWLSTLSGPIQIAITALFMIFILIGTSCTGLSLIVTVAVPSTDTVVLFDVA